MAYIFDLNDIHNTTLDWRLVIEGVTFSGIRLASSSYELTARREERFALGLRRKQESLQPRSAICFPVSSLLFSNDCRPSSDI